LQYALNSKTMRTLLKENNFQSKIKCWTMSLDCFLIGRTPYRLSETNSYELYFFYLLHNDKNVAIVE